MKRKLCIIPECGRPQNYPSTGLCRRCYARQWHQVNVIGRADIITRTDLTLKSVYESTLKSLREKETEAEEGALRINAFAKVPRSDYAVQIRIYKVL